MAEAPVAGARLALSLGVLVAVPLLALNLRPAVTSVGAMLIDIQAGTGMSAVVASAVVAAPVWCFAVGGALAWSMRSRFGTSRTVSLALALLAVTLAARVLGGPLLLLAGTVVACLAIAVLGTLLPVITHAAPARAWALLTGCYVAAMGGGSGIGALITPQVAGHGSWQLGVSGWALLAAAAWAAWRVAARRFTEPTVRTKKHPGPGSLAPAGSAWSLTLHFGLASGFTFSIMGWLPSILLDYSHVDPPRVEWMFTVAMALGVPIALLVPRWARATAGQSGLAVALAAPSLTAMIGLLMFPGWAPWLWSIGLGLGMPAVGLALAMISMRAAPDGDTAAALSSMVQGIGYAIAGATALACGLLHSSTQSWEWPLLGLLVVLCGQIVAGMHAGLPIMVYTGGRPPVYAPAQRIPAPLPPAARRALPSRPPRPQPPPTHVPVPPARMVPDPRYAPPMLPPAYHTPMGTPPRGLPGYGPAATHRPMGGPTCPVDGYGPVTGPGPANGLGSVAGRGPAYPTHGPTPPARRPLPPRQGIPEPRAPEPHVPEPRVPEPRVPEPPADDSRTESLIPKPRTTEPPASDPPMTESLSAGPKADSGAAKVPAWGAEPESSAMERELEALVPEPRSGESPGPAAPASVVASAGPRTGNGSSRARESVSETRVEAGNGAGVEAHAEPWADVPVQLELALVLDPAPRRPDPDVLQERTIHIPYPRQPNS
ncbi:MFS transporter [Actinophytocola sp.]|uniref:MFS transporter n=1 Tax=Actinophytocola sp. TaxID=1872138 RepID=UPI003D6AE7A6